MWRLWSKKLALPSWQLLPVLTLVVGLIGIGFGHRINTAETSPEFTAFLAAGGSLADLCAEDTDSHHGTMSQCEACRLVSAALLPEHPQNAALALIQRPAPQHPAPVLVVARAALDLSHPTRAPPRL
ncbi:hypothetical protein [Phaeobacter sp.]|uniref:hypothetical protein n=1 Tax=Phaeobacter sp. TaxID=1902409 RepID=UPI0025F22410|nr:hypothetical protein [Phaeobacter sp.]